ncbi:MULTISPECIES: amidohydrolase [unclassified Crossiella]|uniref:amidohydrolase n=1 Tax=unclassified Crossiella TaxID=2620835 RepID=UPI001FFEF274|nr:MULTISPECIES: amidohydrolase [unclassified Crossiella]MCK2244479.1 amidohydrolase [Crossiella sp. S99.2]MCK2258110.1 amidohydrolase [Crossiella sp. S99.1]
MDHGVGRRRVLQLFGLSAGAGVAAMRAADPVLGATLAYDEAIGVSAEQYRAPSGLAKDSAAKQAALAWVDGNAAAITGLSDAVWEFAELSLQEWRSAQAIAELLRRNGFRIEWGTGGFPAAFTATYGSGKPVLGFNVEYDALPGLSQKRGAGTHDPLVYNHDAYGPTYGAGHGDAHNALGAGATGAAIAVRHAMERHGLPGTLKVFGSTGEEQLVGKPFAVKAGAYEGLDAYLDWHPFAATLASWNTTSALASATFTFLGAAGHGGSPLGNKSGLDGALLMATMTEYLREKNVAPSGRFHYAIINGGGAPNVTPDMCSIWFFVREGSPARLTVLYDKIVAAAEAAAKASQTRLVHKFHAATWNSLGNKIAAELADENMRQIGPPQFSAEDQRLARTLQKSLGRPEIGLPTQLVPLTPPPAAFLGGPSTDAADVSWRTPKVTVLAATFPPGIPHHNWAVTSAAASGIAHKGLLAAAKYLAATAVDLLTQPEVLAAIRKEFEERTAGAGWKSLIPDGTQPPLYEPPADFLQTTGQQWPPPGVTWPPPPVVSTEQLGTTGPELRPGI